MRSTYHFYLILLLMLSIGCSSSSNEEASSSEIDALLEEVMDIHDEVMPEMGNIHKLGKDLEKKMADSQDAEANKHIQEVIQRLKASNEGMMTWMKEFKQPKSGDEEAETIAYLKGEKEKVNKVKEDMLGSMELAQQILQN